MPYEARLADPLAGKHRVALVADPRKLENTKPHPASAPGTPAGEAGQVAGC